MTGKCTICAHPKRKEIEQALVSLGISLRKVAQKFEVSYDALHRHQANGHIARAITKREERASLNEALDLIADADKMVRLTFEMYEDQKDKNPRLALEALNSTHKWCDFRAKLTGAFSPERKDITIQEIDLSDEELIARVAALDARRKGAVDRAAD